MVGAKRIEMINKLKIIEKRAPSLGKHPHLAKKEIDDEKKLSKNQEESHGCSQGWRNIQEGVLWPTMSDVTEKRQTSLPLNSAMKTAGRK